MKTTDEQAVRVAALNDGVNACWLRVSVAYGPLQAVTCRPFGVVGRFLDAAARSQPIQVYGAGTQRRDFVHVDDVVAALVTAGTHPAAAGEVFNIGGPEAVSIADVAKLVAETIGAGTPEHVPWPKEHAEVETGDYWGDLSKVRTVLGWSPTVGIREGIERTWQAERQEASVLARSAPTAGELR